MKSFQDFCNFAKYKRNDYVIKIHFIWLTSVKQIHYKDPHAWNKY